MDEWTGQRKLFHGAENAANSTKSEVPLSVHYSRKRVCVNNALVRAVPFFKLPLLQKYKERAGLVDYGADAYNHSSREAEAEGSRA